MANRHPGGKRTSWVLVAALALGLTVVPLLAYAAAPTQSQGPAPAASAAPEQAWVEELTGYLAKIGRGNRFMVVSFGNKVVQYASDPKLPELVMDVPAQAMTPAERTRFERNYPGFHRVDYKGGYSYQVNFKTPGDAARAARRLTAEVWRLPPGQNPKFKGGHF